ncbi:SirB2 family protein [Pseudoalteromonas shioyasakiensis]|uniref:SirB2 family protein n=1 Tax=Pseudoalteromonas TaxID=53246 RepID=UPI000C983C07|nr:MULTISPECIES: SirB2 family protein [Pseudoalteromonas]MAD03140.1 transcriptional regulator [Pseudoalteromonas sp.]MCQ8881823.1 SirB2 family protein [Pseudoalteromonas shioyasakiensis]NIZ07734.1 SirB2 family protein [Pseudoalteromonas sp. HF66]QLE09765.1 SirB2 family protein [Pseudoalteromonas shioyasakiensis]|tara:strand:- start:8090 stop:8464 length:375 start_codon:yes stop_codon:yes gene_type:complete
MDYLAVKHTHMLFAVLSIILFYVRSFSRLKSGTLAKNKVVFIGSHSIDTLLLVSAVVLIVMAGLNPLEQSWLLEKIILVIAYIVLGVVAAKQNAKSAKLVLLVITTLILLAIGYLASAKTALLL